MAVNLGDDADTTGAVYGQLAGAFYGASGIPSKWLKEITKRPFIEELAAQLLDAAETTAAETDATVPEKPLPLPSAGSTLPKWRRGRNTNSATFWAI